MSYRPAKFVSTILAGILAGANLAAVAGDAAKPADNCLSGPKGAVPAGGHWYYRIDRATKRHCWYIGEEKDKTARAAPQDSSSSTALANSALPQQGANARKSIADARAELPLPQTRVEPDPGIVDGQRTPAQAGKVENSEPANAMDAGPQRSVVAWRWPGSSDINAPAAGPVRTNPDANRQSASKAAPTHALAAVTLAAADTSSEKQSGSIQMLLVIVVGALSLAGLMGSAVYRFGGMRWNARRETGRDRRAIWDPAGTGPLTRSVSPAGDPKDRIGEMIARLSRSTAT